jgi:hypothetical protein
MRAHKEAMHAACECHIDRCNRIHLGTSHPSWENLLMNKDVDMGVAGSLTMIVLVLSTAFLLRSFYKRYTRLQNREDDGQN